MHNTSCDFCWRHCSIANGKTGVCGVRKNQNGTIVTTGYGQVVSMAVDPVEKKPLYHFMPGSKTFSFALFGCNFTCSFCQNYPITQKEYISTTPIIGNEILSPSQIVTLALDSGCPSVSYTYSEPIVWQDYMIETAALAKENGLKNIMVTNGSFSKEALERVVPLIDAFNIDVKGDRAFYNQVCQADLEPVLDSIAYVVKANAHLEVTTMVIEGMHTSKMIQELGKALKELNVQVWHLSRFFPRYKFSSRKPTSEEFLSEMIEEAKLSSIPYIYGGNSARSDVTYCPSCHTLLMGSHSYEGKNTPGKYTSIKKGRCEHCGLPIYGLFP
ncbi:pyruvate-formate lyase-activating enzyme [Sphaerochaeta pleomorpha str. Grapes]|uniref:Pyruvate-formate lyase-activating enzyme n=1 Tax=Sphaerochaeta pleomorpha (strain ATCC BAA-1885 / DSM 22778 / Grapes) TaxID=158190 RepID=G8QV98_SPHPG|nr:AmmeMemoRadiSam system radical SAM enzyme [Sphaerochaeta pleomorpha]AEV30413.1 pyruvate-formate lyase-activating enzyme [Sphaerochaeta pleomorpha str. Grapes]